MDKNKPLKAFAQQLQIMNKALAKVYCLDDVKEVEELVTRVAESKLMTAQIDEILQRAKKKT